MYIKLIKNKYIYIKRICRIKWIFVLWYDGFIMVYWIGNIKKYDIINVLNDILVSLFKWDVV